MPKRKPASPKSSDMGNPITPAKKKVPKPSAQLDPFVPDEFGVIPPQTGELTIKGVPVVWVPAGDLPSFQPISTESKENPKDKNNEDEHEQSSRSPQPTSSDVEKNRGDAVSSAASANFICPNCGQLCNGYGNGCKCSTPKDETTQPTSSANEKNPGDVANRVAAVDSNSPDNSLESAPLARARDGETKSQCWERLRREGRAAGMTRKGAIAYASGEVERLFPPPEPVIVEELPAEPEPIGEPISHLEPEPEEKPAPAPEPAPDPGVLGLGDLPKAWPELPANAQLQVEIAWVSANRLRVRSGQGVDLSRALSPAPSYSALSWLETSILFPSKFADISVKATADHDDEREFVKREKMEIEEIRAILSEMLEANG